MSNLFQAFLLLSPFDGHTALRQGRVVITGTILEICYADGMNRHLRGKKIRIFDYTRFAAPLREEIRKIAEKIARENGLETEPPIYDVSS